MREGYEIKNYLSEKTLGDATAHEMKARFDIQYEEALAMEFMEAREVTEPSSPEVEAAGEDDLDEICACMERFLIDCNLQNKLNREAIRRSIGDFRVIRSDGRIVSVGKAVRDVNGSMRITNVYTCETCRGKGYARKVVNTIKTMCSNLTGMMCDGAKQGCALKVYSGVSAAVQAALLSMRGIKTNNDGIIEDDIEKTIRNVGLIGTAGMEQTDRTILEIMTQKEGKN